MLKKFPKNKKGSVLVEKILMTAFAVAAGGAVIMYTRNVIIEAKNTQIQGILNGNSSNSNTIIHEGNSYNTNEVNTYEDLVVGNAYTFTVLNDGERYVNFILEFSQSFNCTAQNPFYSGWGGIDSTNTTGAGSVSYFSGGDYTAKFKCGDGIVRWGYIDLEQCGFSFDFVFSGIYEEEDEGLEKIADFIKKAS